MIIKTDELVRLVRTALNHNPRRGGPLDAADIETLSLDQRILHYLPEAIRRAEMEADHSDFDSSPSFIPAGGELFSDNHGAYWLTLPPDFMRLVELRLEGWNRSIYSLTDARSTLLRLAALPGGGELVANRDTPLAALDRSHGVESLRIYGAEGCGKVVTALYRPEPTLCHGAYEVAPRLLHKIISNFSTHC